MSNEKYNTPINTSITIIIINTSYSQDDHKTLLEGNIIGVNPLNLRQVTLR